MHGRTVKFFDPRFILALIFFAFSAYFLGNFTVSKAYKAREKANSQAAKAALDAANERIHELELAGKTIVDSRLQSLKQELKNEKSRHKRFIAGVRSGAIRLSIPIAACPAELGADSATAGGSGNETRAELKPETASTLDAITVDGDDAIRTLNSCIDIYNRIREKYNVQGR
jgi:prophage endopeptidase